MTRANSLKAATRALVEMDGSRVVRLAGEDDFEGWRNAAREAAAALVADLKRAADEAG